MPASGTLCKDTLPLGEIGPRDDRRMAPALTTRGLLSRAIGSLTGGRSPSPLSILKRVLLGILLRRRRLLIDV